MADDFLSDATPAGGDFLHDAVPSGTDMAGSVFDKPTMGQRLKRMAPAIGGAFPPVAGAEAGAAMGSEFGPVGAGLGAVAGAALGGAVAPGTERAVESATTGEPYQPPTTRDELKSALWNAAFTGAGELGGAAVKGMQATGQAKAVLSELPSAQRTVSKLGKIRGALGQISERDLRNRDFWKAHGLSDDQIDAVVASPEAQKELANSIEAAGRTKQAFQTIVDHTRGDFNTRYQELLGPHADVKIDAAPIAQQFGDLAQGTGQHELTPSFRGFLARKAQELRPFGHMKSASISAKEIDPDAPVSTIPGRGQSSSSNLVNPMGIEQLRDLRTELRENLPSSATNLDKKAAKQLNDLINQEVDGTLTKAGASPVEIANLRALDAEYGRFQETIRSLDPRSERFGTEVANALFDPMAKNPGSALNLVDLAQKAEQARPNEVMPQLRGAFLDKALNEARTPGQPFEEAKAIEKLQNTWGGEKEMRAVTGALFGKDSPLANPTIFGKVMGAMNDPAAIAAKLEKDAKSGGYNILSSSYIRGMMVYGAVGALAGNAATHGGLFMALTGQKGPEAMALALGSILAGAPLIKWVAGSGNSPVQKAMVGFLTNPNVSTATEYAGRLSGGVTASMMSLLPAQGNEPKPETMSEPPDPRETMPLPTLDAAWHKARADKDDAQAKEIRDIVVKRMKAGEYKSMPPDMRKQLAPWLREMAGLMPATRVIGE